MCDSTSDPERIANLGLAGAIPKITKRLQSLQLVVAEDLGTRTSLSHPRNSPQKLPSLLLVAYFLQETRKRLAN